uniref:MLO8 n=1 Tax=Vitis pseudoreticulata TaxID=231512 RepID=A0A0P0BUR8_VITPS|nr:MLO8 [Vitis pseudoreticulata]
MNPEPASLEETPTWAVSIFCLAFFVISGSIDAGLHRLTKFLKKRKRKALNRALGRIKIEAPISKICVPQSMANSFLPCKDAPEMVGSDVSSHTEVSGTTSNTTTPPTHETTDDDSYCEAKGKVSLASREGIAQLNIFISVLAVFHVLYCVLTMCLGIAKMRKWKAWEKETQTLEYQIANDPMRFRFTRQTSFGRRHLKFWSDYPLLIWPVCLVRQFTGPVLKADYFTLRNGFIMAHLGPRKQFQLPKVPFQSF